MADDTKDHQQDGFYREGGEGLWQASGLGEKRFRAELRYRMSLSVARALRKDGILSEEEYSQIDTILLQKHRPVLGTLLAGKPLQ